jgi:uncharacterized protein YggE
MHNFFERDSAFKMGKMLMLLAFIAILYIGMKFLNEVKTYSTIGTMPMQTTIDVAGSGEASAVPDIATINFSVEAQGKTVEIAQNLMNTKVNQALAFLKNSNIDSKDIQTTNYNAYPEYSNQCIGMYPCVMKPNDAPQIVGYKVNENVTVKIRAVDTAGKIVDGLGASGITGISGPDFSVDKPEKMVAEAKQKAIDDAKEKAEVLAKQLGLHLGKIVRFSGDQGGTPMPMMYAQKSMDSMGGSVSSSASLQTGQNKYNANVVITYEVY